MTDNVLEYAHYFPTGTRVEVEILLAEGRLLRDDAIVASADRDLLELHLSRHISPGSAFLEMGTDLFIRTGKEGEGYRCRAIFLRCDDLCRLHVRLAGEVVPCNEREYFRVDVFIPLSYQPYSGHKQEMIREEGTEAHGIKPFPVAANLSGAGVRVNIPEHFEIDQLLELTLYLPFGEKRIMPLVGQVVHVIELSRPGDPYPLFATALRFVSVDEADREALIRFIHQVQVEQLKRLREESLRRAAPAVPRPEPLFSRRRVVRTLIFLLSALILAGLALYLDNYRRHKTKGVIERTFEEQIRKIIEGE